MGLGLFLPERLFRKSLDTALTAITPVYGVWTPGTTTANLSFSPAGAGQTRYTKIGKMVFAAAYVSISNTSGGSIGSWTVTGLPATCGTLYGPCGIYYGLGSLGTISSTYVEANANFAIMNCSVGIPAGSSQQMWWFNYEASA